MKRLIAIICILAAILTLFPAAVFAASSIQIVVMSTTDMNGRCWDTDLVTNKADTRNMLKVKSAVDQTKASYGADKVIVIDNGDLYSGTPVSETQLKQYTQGTSELPPAMALCLADIGYDAAGIGDEEFALPWDTMQAVRTYLDKKGVSTVCANVYDEATGANLFTPYITRDFAVGGKTLKVGILGLTSTDCPRLGTVDKDGILFHHPDNTDRSVAWEINRYVPQMKAAGCGYIIVTYHGGFGNTEGALVYGKNTENQGARIVAETEGVNMLIMGHDCSTKNSNVFLHSKNGLPVLLLNGGGSEITRTVLDVTVSGGSINVSVHTKQNLIPATYASDLSLTAKMCPYAEAVRPGAGYYDLKQGSWYAGAASEMIRRGIMGSTTASMLKFEPDTACTRSMIVTILYSLAGKPDVSYEQIDFPDVEDGQWYTAPVMWAYQNGVVSGYDNGDFGTNDKITREQMAVILMAYTEKISGSDTSDRASLAGFPDAYKVTWSKDAVEWAVSQGLLSGKKQNGKTYLDPRGNATRAEAACIFNSFLKLQDS